MKRCSSWTRNTKKPGGGYALPGLRSVLPAFNLFTMLAETAGVGGLKIAETYPAGRMDAG
ncbi:hypothetical protein B8032_12185 [Klebsiella pneumoniae]|nr:hypothetical protein B8032_12185 [Klebsiella pneumoniae]